MVNAIQQHINGQLVDGKSGRKSPVFNPATGEQSGEINLANTAQVNEAIADRREMSLSLSLSLSLYPYRMSAPWHGMCD